MDWVTNNKVNDEQFAELRQNMTYYQTLPYSIKKGLARDRVHYFEDIAASHQKRTHISVGGLDSIVLYKFIHDFCGRKHIPAISVSTLEDKSIQEVHRQLGVEIIQPYKSKVQVIQEHGYPIISKEKAGKIDALQNPSENNRTVRHAIMTGETGKQGGYRTGTRMRLPQKWLDLFGGMENETYGTNYMKAPFRVSNKCCYYMKEKPCDDWAKRNDSWPYLGLMASEGGQREKALIKNGCNYVGKTAARSCPFAFFTRQDLLQLALELEAPVPKIYGEIKWDSDGLLYTTRAQRTGCSMCGFGIHIEDRPHRFDRLREDNLSEWEFWMYEMGWGDVLSYIGVEWESEPEPVYEPLSMWS